MQRKEARPTVAARVSETEHTLITTLAALDGKSLSDWIHDIIVPVAQRRVKELTPEAVTKRIDDQIADLEKTRDQRVKILKQAQSAATEKLS